MKDEKKGVFVGKILILAGGTGSGKTSLTDWLECETRYMYIPSVVDRVPSPGDRPGETHYFVPPKEFDELEAAGMFLVQPPKVFGSRYGLLAEPVLRAKYGPDRIILNLIEETALEVQRRVPGTLLVHVKPPEHAMAAWARDRGDGDGARAHRLDGPALVFHEERYDCVLVNEPGRFDELCGALKTFLHSRDAW